MRKYIAPWLIALLAGCGGGASQAVPAAGPALPQPANTSGLARFVITVPTASPTSTARKAQYISSNTQSVIITLNTVGGVAFSGTAVETAANLTPSNPACSGSPLQCTVAVPAAPGADVFTVSLYDATQSSTNPVTPAGHLLSTGTIAVTVVAGQNSTPATPLTLDGIPATITATFPADQHISGSALAGYSIIGNRPYTLTFTAQDASGATIVGAGSPTLSSNNSAAVSLTQVNANTYTVQVKKYNAGAVALTASTPSGNALSVNVTTVQELWLVTSANDVEGYALFPNCSPSCAQLSADTITAGLSSPTGLAFDASGNLWVTDALNPSVTEYVPPANVVVATISDSANLVNPSGLVFDANGKLWVADNGARAVFEYQSPFNGAIAIASISGLNGPNGIAFDASNNLWVAATTSSSTVTQYSGTSSGPSISIPHSSIGPLAFDTSGDLWIAGNAGGPVKEYVPPLTSASTASASISSGFSGIKGLAFDGAGQLYAANFNTRTVTGYVPANGATPISGTPIALANSPESIAITP